MDNKIYVFTENRITSILVIALALSSYFIFYELVVLVMLGFNLLFSTGFYLVLLKKEKEMKLNKKWLKNSVFLSTNVHVVSLVTSFVVLVVFNTTTAFLDVAYVGVATWVVSFFINIINYTWVSKKGFSTIYFIVALLFIMLLLFSILPFRHILI